MSISLWLKTANWKALIRKISEASLTYLRRLCFCPRPELRRPQCEPFGWGHSFVQNKLSVPLLSVFYHCRDTRTLLSEALLLNLTKRVQLSCDKTCLHFHPEMIRSPPAGGTTDALFSSFIFCNGFNFIWEQSYIIQTLFKYPTTYLRNTNIDSWAGFKFYFIDKLEHLHYNPTGNRNNVITPKTIPYNTSKNIFHTMLISTRGGSSSRISSPSIWIKI